MHTMTAATSAYRFTNAAKGNSTGSASRGWGSCSQTNRYKCPSLAQADRDRAAPVRQSSDINVRIATDTEEVVNRRRKKKET